MAGFSWTICMQKVSIIIVLVLFLQLHGTAAQNCTYINCDGCECFEYSEQKYGLICINYTAFTIPYCVNEDVVYISIQGGIVDKMEGREFENAPYLEVLEIENNVIYDVRPLLLWRLPYLKKLLLHGNQIGKSLDWPFNNTYLQTLDLSKNQFYFIEDGYFTMLPNLTLFDISDNFLVDIYEPFDGLESIQEMRFSYNSLKHVKQNTFKPCGTVRTLHFDNNDISLVEDGSFDQQVNLETLNLNSNMFWSLPTNLFQYCCNLKFLDLSSTLLHEFPTEMLQKAVGLISLNFDQNPVNTLKTNDISAMANLIEIKLSRLDYLMEVQEKAFMNMNQLEVINMTWNAHLADIHVEAFHSATLGSLKSLYLSYNYLHVIQQQWFMDKDSLENADVHGNPIHCNCTAQWVSTF